MSHTNPSATTEEPGPAQDARLLSKIETGSARVGIIGLGYVGLPLARAFAEAGIAVLGFDVDPAKVAKLRTGRELHRPHRRRDDPRDARERLRGDRPTSSGSTSPTPSSSACPTPLTEAREPDLTYVVDSGAGDRRAAAARPARRPGEHDLSRHDARGRPADPRGARA